MPLASKPRDVPPRFSVDRSSKSLKDVLKMASQYPKSNKPRRSTLSVSDMCFPVNTSRSFLCKSGKMKTFPRAQVDAKPVATHPQAGPPPADVTVKQPKYLDILGTALVEEHALPKSRSIPRRSASSHKTKTGEMEKSVVRSDWIEASLQGDIDPSSSHFTYLAYLDRAFNLANEDRRRSTSNTKVELAGDSSDSLEPWADTDNASMEVPFQLSAKDRRPKIQVTIPERRPSSRPLRHHQSLKIGEKRSTHPDETPNILSPPSTVSRRRTCCEASPAELSIVSPLSIVEMPKPQRPFSALSFEDMAGLPRSTPIVTKSAISDSSDDAGEHDDRSSNYSPRSSMSSYASETGYIKVSQERRPSAFSVISPTDAGVFDNMRGIVPKVPKVMKSTSSLIHRNKPLPPEPGEMTVGPLNFSGQSLSRTSSMKARGKVPLPLDVSREYSSAGSTPIDRLSRRTSLRSKYTPADLDALDDAFRNTSPPKPEPYTAPTLSQVEKALEAHLVTIVEESPLIHDPLQISRGPMHMEPSRRAPPPPSRNQHSFEADQGYRKRLQKRSTSHVALQLKAGDQDQEKVRRRVSAMGSSLKADRILGKSRSISPLDMQRGPSSESNWSSSESQRAYELDFSSADDPPTPESDLSSISDAAFEEVRKRLELLSPKDDPSRTFFHLHERNISSSSESSAEFDIQPLRRRVRPSVSVDGLKMFEQPSPARVIPRSYAEYVPATPPMAIEKSQIKTGDQSIPVQIHSSPERRSTVPEIGEVNLPELSVSVEDLCNFGQELSSIEVADDSHIHPLERRGRQEDQIPRSLTSITMSEIPEIYASLPSRTSTMTTLSIEEAERRISAHAAEKVLLRVLRELDNLQDLFAAATVSRGFYRTFKRHELSLMKNALFGMSPAAWELREASSPKLGYTPSLYLRHYMRDMYTMIELKSLILIHCESFLRPDTITALAGGETERSPQVDDAFWRIWTFCKLFGCGETKGEDDVVGQMDWLKGGVLANQQIEGNNALGQDVRVNTVVLSPPSGFAQGNAGGLSAEELYDMTEIWTCLGVLVRGFQGKRQEARDYGIFDHIDIALGDVEKEDAALG